MTIGAVLQEQMHDQWCPIAYFSRKLTAAERGYSTFDRELLAIYKAVKHFRYFIEGRQFHIATDHKPITFALSSRSKQHSPHQTRHLEYIAQFTHDARHIQDTANMTADTLSRVKMNGLKVPSTPIGLDFQVLAKAQKEDDTRLDAFSTSLQLEKVPIPASAVTLLCDVSTGCPRSYVPPGLRRQGFDNLHSMSHLGIRATQRLLTSCYIWPNINADVRRWTRSCVQCQRSKVHRHTVTPMGSFSPPDARFNHVHIDIVGPLPPAKGNTHLLTCVDRFTRWPEVIPLSDTSTETVAQAFLLGWIARFGVPTTLTSDRGGQFESNVWNHLMQLLGIHRIHTTAYHPCSNGLVEHLHHQLKASLMAHLPQTNWVEFLPLVLLGIRTALKEDIQQTSAELVYGTTLRLPGVFFFY